MHDRLGSGLQTRVRTRVCWACVGMGLNKLTKIPFPISITTKKRRRLCFLVLIPVLVVDDDREVVEVSDDSEKKP